MFVELTELCLKLEQYKNMPDRKLLEKNYYSKCSRVLNLCYFCYKSTFLPAK